MDRRGVSLVETVVYTAILAMAMASMVSFTLLIVEANNKNGIMREVNENAQIALNILSEKIRLADAVTVPAVSASGGRLEMVMPGGGATVFETQDGRLVINEGGQSEFLMSDRVAMEDLQFVNLGGQGLASIKISFTMKQNRGANIDHVYSLYMQSAVTMRP